MPGGDGVALAGKIASMTGEKPLVFICSGYNDLTPALVHEMEIRKVFEKPFNSEEFVSEIAQQLSSKV
jgi:DNA-binding LytR/AlgR family response regulator